jgi:membrane protease YdiL (CAAX protease family)
MPSVVVEPGVSGPMTTAVAIGVVLLVLVVTNVWVHVGPSRMHMVTGPLTAGLLLLVGRLAGLSWQELGLGWQTMLRGVQGAVLAVAAVAIVYAVAVAIPVTRGAFRDTRYRIGRRAALYTALVAIPLGTVLFEEVAFRGVLWGLLVRDFGAPLATAVSAGLFGVWHVLPATGLARTHTSVKGPTAAAADRRRVGVTVLATIVFTTLAGIVFAELRRRSGSLITPIGLHWATNGLGVIAAARVWAVSSDVVTPDVHTSDVHTSDVHTSDVHTPEAVTPDAGSTGASERFGSPSQPAWQRIVRRLWSSRP